jgi:hypothetical protein
MLTYFTQSVVSDSTGWFDILWNQQTRPFFNFILNGLELSYQDDFNTNYKIAGFSVFRNAHFTTITRSTYDVLGLIGDLGGFFDGWLFLGAIMLGWFAKFQSVAFFMQQVFYTTAPSSPYKRRRTDEIVDLPGQYVNKRGAHRLSRQGMLDGLPFSSEQI